MSPPPSITLNTSPHPALDYAGLRAEALELLGQLCGDQWSDFNSHDPGITILEQLCFALTELAYRSQWPIEDLIASAGPDWQPGPQEILHGDPVTREDLIALARSLGYEAAAVEKLEQTTLPLLFRPSSLTHEQAEAAGAGGEDGNPQTREQPQPVGDLELCTELEAVPGDDAGQAVRPRGLWRVSVQLGSGTAGDGPDSLLPIARALHAGRLLGRDFELAILDPFKVIVRADLEVDLGPAGSAGVLLERIAALLDANIRRAAAAADGRGLRSAELIQALQSLPEVREVCALRLAQDPADPGHPLHLALPGRTARLDPISPIRLLHQGLPLPVPASLPLSSPRGPAVVKAMPPPTPTGRARRLTTHQSIARQLPAVYGVGLAGLPANASPARRAQAQQLRAYLLFFDQLLANAQAQLAFASQLLAPVAPSEPDPLATEAVLVAEDPELPAASLRRSRPEAWPEELRQALAHSAPTGDTIAATDRRAALLAHLLQRFGEELLPPPGAASAGSREARATELVHARSAYLRRISPLTGGRGSGPDVFAAAEGQGPCAERLQRKLSLPLGPNGAPSLLVIEHLLLRPLADDDDQAVLGGEEPIPFLSDVVRPDPWTGRLSVVINAALLPTSPGNDQDRWLLQVLRQELPAHLAVELHLLADGSGEGADRPWSTLLGAWQRFRGHLRSHRLALLERSADREAALRSLELRDSRDRLITLLRIGRPWPLRSIPMEELRMVASGQSAWIDLPFSQEGVRYQLVEVSSGSRCGEPTEGTGGPLRLVTPPISADLTLRVEASVMAAEGIALTANGRPRSTLLAGEVRVVEGVDVGLGLRLHDAASHTPLPRLHPEHAALLADHGQRLVVEVVGSQEGVVYEVIDESERERPFKHQQPLSQAVTGTTGSIWLELEGSAAEDRDLTVRAKLARRRGKHSTEESKVLASVIPLRVRANPAVPLALLTPIVKDAASAAVAIGAEAADEGAGSQKSVEYQLLARSFGDDDWRFDDPSRAAELTRVGSLEGFSLQAGSGRGTGTSLRLAQVASGEAQVVAAVARKSHRRNALRSDDTSTQTSEVPLQQAAVLFTEPDTSRGLLLRREPEAVGMWSLWGGQPGVAYTLVTGEGETARPLGPALPIAETDDAPAGRRGIGRQRLGRDLVVVDEGPPRVLLDLDPGQQPALGVRARFLRSGVEAAMDQAPALAWVEPPAVGRGEEAVVVVSGLPPSQTGRLGLGERRLDEAVANRQGNLQLATGPLPGASELALDVGVRCPLPIAQGVNTDLAVRLRNGEPLLEGAPAQLLAWGSRAEVAVAASQRDVTYVLIDAAERDKPPERRRTCGEAQTGTGGTLLLRSSPLQEDVDLLVVGTRRIDARGDWPVHGVLQMVVPVRVRANPAVPLAVVEPVLEPASPCQLWVGDGTLPSQSSVSYKAWAKPLLSDHWQWPGGQDGAAKPLLPTPPEAAAPEANWTGRGQPKKGTDGVETRGQAGRLQLTLGQAGRDACLAVIASKQHNPHPLDTPQPGSNATSQVVLDSLLVQLTTPNPDQRLALVGLAEEWRLVGGEPGCFYRFAAPGTGQPLAEAVYVHQRTADDPAGDWGIDRLRLGVDLVVAGGEGAGLDYGPDAEALLAAGVEARRAFSGTTTPLRLGPLVVTLEPPAEASGDTATVVVRGLAPGERVRLRQSEREPQEATGAMAAVRLGTGAVPLGSELSLEVSREGAAIVLTIPVPLVLRGQATP
jgi:hypothetical protein